jgi:hypothetical protein
MKIEQKKWTEGNGWETISNQPASMQPQLVMVFGSSKIMKEQKLIMEIKLSFPSSIIIGCSTAGEICGTEVADDSLVTTAVQFDHSTITTNSIRIASAEDSYVCGEELIKRFDPKGLKHIFVLSDGLHVNGSELVAGMRSALPPGVSVTGGLAGDGPLFQQTFVLNEASIASSNIVSAIALYGERLTIGYGSFGGWDSFGIERIVTRSKGNVLYELDNSPALELYKSFLGEQADNLPASGLLFPLSVRMAIDSLPVVRTILAVNEEEQSLTFAGDIPQGSYIRLMKANLDRLIDGALTAAEASLVPLGSAKAELAILISCVGRKLVLKQLVEEEVEGVCDVLGKNTIMTGFYSYGEISPFSKDAKCELHNQTMTITTFSEL